MKKSNMNAFIKKIPKVEAKEIELKDNAFSGMKIQVKPTLNIDEANRFVSQIVDSIVGMEDMSILTLLLISPFWKTMLVLRWAIARRIKCIHLSTILNYLIRLFR